METYVTITPRFQVHIPVAIRKKIGLKHHGRAKMKVEKGKITITPIEDGFLKLAGIFKLKNPIPADKIRDYIDYSW